VTRALKRLWFAAVLAMVLLSYASVQSVVMQAVMAAGHDMPGMQHAAPPPTALPPAPAAEHAHHHMDGMDMSAMDMSSHAEHMQGAAPGAAESQPAPAKSDPADPCAFCQAAAHAPLVAVAASLALPSAVAYLPPLPAETPRAPGLWREHPKARGPPLFA
jgi:hypothetical protein